MSTSSIKTTFKGYVSYQGREGQRSFLLHRITGLGVLLFLGIHILDTATVYFAPQFYSEVINLYRSTIFGIGEIALVFCLFFHGINGARVAYIDLFKPVDWTKEKERRSVVIGMAITLILFIPSALWMAYNILRFNYGMFGG